MKKYRVTCTASAVIEETWEIDAPEGVEVNEENALDLIENAPREGVAVRFISDHAIGDEQDRAVSEVWEP